MSLFFKKVQLAGAAQEKRSAAGGITSSQVGVPTAHSSRMRAGALGKCLTPGLPGTAAAHPKLGAVRGRGPTPKRKGCRARVAGVQRWDGWSVKITFARCEICKPRPGRYSDIPKEEAERDETRV